MAWTIEYYEQADARQPAEVFEDLLSQSNPKLAGKLARIAVALQAHGPRLGGGLIEPCREYNGMWEMRAIYIRTLGREFFGFDATRVVLLHGYVKRLDQKASTSDMNRAFQNWADYQRTHRISPEQEENDESI